MKIHCEILLEYESHEKAENIEKALSVDNEGFLKTTVEGNVVICKFCLLYTSPSPRD